ncbi:MAG: DUF1624 domain-containing protein [Caldilineales bacterium]|nr:DUF1624 domain-containing protein [Caldilineales bacterium]
MISTYFSGMRASIRPVRHLRSERLWEIDALRGIAIIMMVIYHLLWDLRGLGGYDINVNTGFWHYWQLVTASTFIGVMGLSLTLSFNYARSHGRTDNLWPKYLLRGFEIFSWGILVGIVTFLFQPNLYVRFGILHLIGVSIMLSYPFLNRRWLALGLGLALILLAELVGPLGLNFNWLDWLGLDATPRPAFDHFPLIPWFGVALIGIFLGDALYPDGKRRFGMPDLGQRWPVRGLRLMGQNSLLIYLIHQPILILLLTITGLIQL